MFLPQIKSKRQSKILNSGVYHLFNSYYVLGFVLGTSTLGDTILFTTFCREESDVGRSIYTDNKWWSWDSNASSILLRGFQSSMYSFHYIHQTHWVKTNPALYILSSNHPIHILFLSLPLPGLIFLSVIAMVSSLNFLTLVLHLCQLSVYCPFTPNPSLFGQLCDEIPGPINISPLSTVTMLGFANSRC